MAPGSHVLTTPRDECNSRAIFLPSKPLSALHISRKVIMSTNLFYDEDNDRNSLPDVELPPKIVKIISYLDLLEPWTNAHSRHGEVGALQDWLSSLHGDIALAEMAAIRKMSPSISTCYTDDEGLGTYVSACPNDLVFAICMRVALSKELAR